MADAHGTVDAAERHPDRVRHALGRHAASPTASWSAWQPVGAGGAIASPAARYIQYRARMATADRRRVADARARADHLRRRAPTARRSPGTVTAAPAAPKTNQTLTATPSGFTDPDGDPLTYHYRVATATARQIAGATSASLNLALPGNGDRGDEMRVEVYATDGRGAASDPAFADR